jgi:RNA polymerase sigma factor (TIGR02999 family)
LQPTELVNEAFLRLVGPGDVEWDSRAHFFGAAAQAIRRILTDHARSKNRVKRGSGVRAVFLDEAQTIAVNDEEILDFVELDQALERLTSLDAQKARVVELRFFAGLTADQTAAALGVSESTVHRDWQFARAWLHRELSESGERT